MKKIIRKIFDIFSKIKRNLKFKKKHIKTSYNIDIINCEVSDYCNFAHNCSVTNSFIGKRTSIGRYSKISHSLIGAYCSISWDVTIGALAHPMDRISTHAFSYRKQFGIVESDIKFEQKITTIGNDVWIGCGAIILSGVTIGDGAIIGAGAVVTKDVEPYSVVAGVPAKTIKMRFDDDTINRLLKIKWWELPDNTIKSKIDYFSSTLSKEMLDNMEKEKVI